MTFAERLDNFIRNEARDLTFYQLCERVIEARMEKEELFSQLSKKIAIGTSCNDLIVVNEEMLEEMLKQKTCPTCACKNYCFNLNNYYSCVESKMKYLKGEL